MALEFRKIFAYRVDFWSGFLGSTVVEMTIVYFVWRAVFDHRGVDMLNGFSFTGLMLYYLIAQMVNHIVQGQTMHFISTEIYEGSLNRYIVYPLPFLYYKFLSHITFGLMASLQLLLGIGLFFLMYGEPQGVNFNFLNLALAVLVALIGASLYFLMAAILEMTAFWAENVWSLMVMLRFATRLCGGLVVPLVFFPAWSQPLIKLSPFYVAAALPIEVALGRVGQGALISAFCVTAVWIGLFLLVTWGVWQRGRLKYTGVGI